MTKIKYSTSSRKGTTQSRQQVKDPIDERSPSDQTTGGYDPEDYHGSGSIAVGETPVHAERRIDNGIEIGIRTTNDPRLSDEPTVDEFGP